jgi:hypothetical protein
VPLERAPRHVARPAHVHAARQLPLHLEPQRVAQEALRARRARAVGQPRHLAQRVVLDALQCAKVALHVPPPPCLVPRARPRLPAVLALAHDAPQRIPLEAHVRALVARCQQLTGQVVLKLRLAAVRVRHLRDSTRAVIPQLRLPPARQLRLHHPPLRVPHVLAREPVEPRLRLHLPQRVQRERVPLPRLVHHRRQPVLRVVLEPQPRAPFLAPHEPVVVPVPKARMPVRVPRLQQVPHKGHRGTPGRDSSQSVYFSCQQWSIRETGSRRGADTIHPSMKLRNPITPRLHTPHMQSTLRMDHRS